MSSTTMDVDLSSCDDDVFMSYVDADLRPPERRDPEVSRALRSPAVVERYYTMLLRKSKSIEGQLAAKEADYEARKARLEGKLGIAEAGAVREDSTDEDRRRALGRAINLRAELKKERSEYQQSRAGTLRFKTGLDMNLVEIKGLIRRYDANRFDQMLAEERNVLAERVRFLENAIRVHRSEIVADVRDGDEVDEELWEVLE